MKRRYGFYAIDHALAGADYGALRLVDEVAELALMSSQTLTAALIQACPPNNSTPYQLGSIRRWCC
jgi:hypothetical protein